ncbi:alpha/beta fold hydrolase [Chitinimonas lacunae]|uniref:Alpha/beta fold hydrolase n=1 Tax=Chitinimonas lacunae TaxID=1963018 RepID=A0ABV8MQ79_9NEIS
MSDFAPGLPCDRQGHVLCGREEGVYRMAFREWGAPDNPQVVICAHGLTRNGRDFERLAHRLSRRFRVVCPDVLGRGDSDWLRNPMGYQLPLYVQDMLVLLAHLQVEQVAWIGTSMGGLIGMLLGSLPGTPIRRLVLNDVGPVLSAVALQRIGDYVGKAPVFTDRAEAEHYIRQISAPFGPHSEAEWGFLCDIMLRRAEVGWRINYDPAIAEPFRRTFSGKDVDLWPFYERITCPTLLTRGVESDLISSDTACAMSERGPRAQWVDFDGVGHAPTFMHADQIDVVEAFLRQDLTEVAPPRTQHDFYAFAADQLPPRVGEGFATTDLAAYGWSAERTDTVQLPDALIGHLEASLSWLPTHNPARAEPWQGLNRWGLTVLEGDTALRAAELCEAWAAVLRCGPKVLDLGGEALERDRMVGSLIALAELARRVEASGGRQVLMHVGA